MKYIRTFTLLALAATPALVWGSGLTIVNGISVYSNSGNIQAGASAGTDGQSVSSSARGTDGTDGANGTVIEGRSSSRVDVHTEVNGKTVEDTHTTVTNDDLPYVHTHVFEDAGVRVETHINTRASVATTSIVKEKTDPLLHAERAVAPITNQYISEGTDTPATAATGSESTRSTPAGPMHNAVQQVRHILSGIFAYVSTIFAYESRQRVLATHESFLDQFNGLFRRAGSIVRSDRHIV